MNVILYILTISSLSALTALVAFLVLYRYNLLTGIDNSQDPKWLIKIRKESKW